MKKETEKKMIGREPWNKEKNLTKEIREKMREAHIGHQVSEETRIRIGTTLMGERHPNWKGGITPLRNQTRKSFEYRKWISNVLIKDDFTCQKCNQRGGKLSAHHYPKSFSEILREYNVKTLKQALDCKELWDIDNGLTLCRKCHKLTDNCLRNYGDTNQSQFNSFLVNANLV